MYLNDSNHFKKTKALNLINHFVYTRDFILGLYSLNFLVGVGSCYGT